VRILSAISIPVLITDATTALKELGYADRVVKYTIGIWREFEKFCNECKFITYHSEIKDKFLLEINTNDPPLKHGTILRKASAMKKLDTFAVKSSWEKGVVLQKPLLPTEFDEFLVAQDELLVKKDYAKQTRETIHDFSMKVLLFLFDKGITNLSDMNAELISEFLLTFKGYAKSTLRGELSRFRRFLKHLYLLGKTPADLSLYVPSYNLGKSDSLVKIWESDDIKKILDVVDVQSQRQKR